MSSVPTSFSVDLENDLMINVNPDSESQTADLFPDGLQAVVTWIKFVNFHAKSPSAENFKSLSQLSEIIPDIPVGFTPNRSLQDIVKRVRDVVRSKIFDPQLSERSKSFLEELARLYPKHVSAPTPEPRTECSPSIFSVSPSSLSPVHFLNNSPDLASLRRL